MKKSAAMSWFALAILILIIVFPLLSILSVIGNEAEIDKYELLSAIKESLLTTGIVVLVTFPLSLTCAVLLYFSNIQLKALFSILCILPMFLPPISIGFGLLSFFGKNGLLFQLFGIRLNLLGKLGIISGHILYTFPIAFLLFINAFRQLDISVYESSLLLKIPFHKYFFRIALPKIKRTVLAIFFQIIIMSFSEYGICLVVGGRTKTLSLLVYRFVIGRLDFKAGLYLGSIALLPLTILSVSNLVSPPIRQTIIYRQFISAHMKTLTVVGYIVLPLVTMISILLVFSQLLMGFTSNYPINTSISLVHIKQVLSEPYIRYLANSLIISAFSSILGCILITFVAYNANKGPSKVVSKILFFIATIPYAIPGLLFGIGYLIVSRGRLLYGSYAILILANIAHFFASPFLLSYFTLSHFSPEIEDILNIYAVPTWKKIKDILIPYLKYTLLDIVFYIFTNSMITISAVAFLSTPHTMPYALVLNSFEGEIEYLGKTASISVVILTINLLLFFLINRIKRLGMSHNLPTEYSSMLD